MSDTFDEALERFAVTGPEFGAGLSNHGPMAADALVALGRGAEVLRWSEFYADRLAARPSETNPIDPVEWREAHVYRVRDGLVGEVWEFRDPHQALSAATEIEARA